MKLSVLIYFTKFNGCFYFRLGFCLFFVVKLTKTLIGINGKIKHAWRKVGGINYISINRLCLKDKSIQVFAVVLFYNTFLNGIFPTRVLFSKRFNRCVV